MNEKTSYKGYKVGQMVKTTRPIKCQYYNYPTGRNLDIIPAGTIAKIENIPPCVRDSGHGDYFFNLSVKDDTKYYPCHFDDICHP